MTTDLVPILGVPALAGLRLLPHLAAMRSAWRTVFAHGQVTSDVLPLLAPPEQSGTGVGALAIGHPIEFEAVTVRREGRVDPLRNLCLVIPRGARIGIAGPLAIAPDSGRIHDRRQAARSHGRSGLARADRIRIAASGAAWRHATRGGDISRTERRGGPQSPCRTISASCW
jgi:hypothetical protein